VGVLTIPQVSTAQEPIDARGLRFCHYYGETPGEALFKFKADTEALSFIQRVTKYTGIPQNFTVWAANVRNASAVHDANTNQRLILYSQDFIKTITQATGDQWAATSVMAHEIGHHLINHTLASTTVGTAKAQEELEADKFSGHVLRKMGASLKDAKTAMERQPDQTPRGYPAKSARLAAIENGWIQSDEEIRVAAPAPSDTATPRPTPAPPAAPATCSVSIRTTPSGAVVKVDDRSRGMTPTQVQLEAGESYSLELAKTGFEAFTGTIDCETRVVSETLQATAGTIQVRYTGDYYACSLDLRITIGSKSFTPRSNLSTFRGVELGMQEYRVRGRIGCPGVGMCMVSGGGSVDVSDGAVFDVVWANTGYAACTVELR
jgi:hypothetical protein